MAFFAFPYMENTSISLVTGVSGLLAMAALVGSFRLRTALIDCPPACRSAPHCVGAGYTPPSWRRSRPPSSAFPASLHPTTDEPREWSMDGSAEWSVGASGEPSVPTVAAPIREAADTVVYGWQHHAIRKPLARLQAVTFKTMLHFQNRHKRRLL